MASLLHRTPRPDRADGTRVVDTPAVALDSVEIRYDRALIGPISLSVPAGSWTCLIGPNGAGKSSVLKAIADLVGRSGAVHIDGVDTSTLTPRELARKVAFVPQQPMLPDDMSVAEYALLGRTPYVSTFGVESRKDRQVCAAVLDDMDLTRFADRLLGQLSGGERQRVVLARALCQQASILLLDEPTSALDIGHAQQVLELVDRLRTRHQLTVIAAMHDLTVAAQYAHELVLMRDGLVTVSGAPGAVLTEESLRTHYGASVRVVHDECGGTVVIPLRPHRS
ncbi:MAG: ABC transporter ATP-binding protein [Acidimicrobiia bacterium]